jgi:uncharacterized protein YbjT (DUF2867 family)
MILVTGATGNIGRELVRLLVAQHVAVRALVRDLTRPIDGVELVRGDLDAPETLPAAFTGVDRVFLLAPGPNIAAQDLAAIAAAERAGVAHVVLVSSGGVSTGTGSGPAHQPGEAALRASKLAWTILRPSEFMSNVLMSRDTIRGQGAFYAPTGGGRSAMIHPHDIAAVAARVLTTPGHEGQIYELTGPEALSRAELAGTLSEAIGRPITYIDIPDAVFREQLANAGAPAFLIDPVARFYALVKAGGAADVQPTVERITGARPRRFNDWARDHAAALR